MARLDVDGSDLVLRLTWKEKVSGFHGDLRVPLSSVRSVSTVQDPWTSMRGWRMAGTALAGVISVGTRRHGTGYDFVAVHGRRPSVRVDLASGRFERLVVSCDYQEDPKPVAERIAAAAGVQTGPPA